MKKGAFADSDRMIKETQKLLDDIDVDIDPKAYIRDLNNGAKQMVEIIRAVSQNSKMVIMDEPTSSLSDHEVMSLFKVIQKLKKRERSDYLYFS